MRAEDIEISNIKIGDRVRSELGDIDQLAESIGEIGLLNPITVEEMSNGKYQLVAGERRLKACKSLGWDKIRATIFEGSEDGD